MKKKTIAITGANSGIGLAAAKELASQGHHILMLCRSEHKGQEAVQQVKMHYPEASCELWQLDLSNFAQIKDVAQRISAQYPKIDVLLNNAGYYPSSITYIGDVEGTLYASHLGHFLLTHWLMPSLKASEEARIVNVSSAAHALGSTKRFFKKVSGISGIQAYGDAKLANVLFAMGLQARMPQNITAYSLHPGVVGTNFTDNLGAFVKSISGFINLFMLTPAQGAATSVYLCTAPISKIGPDKGRYFAKRRPASLKSKDGTPQQAEWLWHESVRLLDGHLQ